MPEFISGKDGTFWVGGNDFSCFTQSVSVSASVEAPEVSTLCDTAKRYIGGQQDGTFSFEGFLVQEYDDPVDLINHRHPFIGATHEDALLFAYLPVNVAGAPCYGGEAFGTSVEVGAEIGGAVAYSGEGQASWFPVAGIVALPKEDHASGAESVADMGASAPGRVLVQVAEGTADITVSVDGSDDGSTWVPVGSETSPGPAQFAFVEETAFRYWRVTLTTSGDPVSGVATVHPY